MKKPRFGTQPCLPACLPGVNAGSVLARSAAGLPYLCFPKYNLRRAAIVCHDLFVGQLKRWKSEVFSYMGTRWSLVVSGTLHHKLDWSFQATDP